MKKMSKSTLVQLLWISFAAALMLLFRLKRRDRAFMNAAADRFAAPAGRALSSVSYRVPWSMMELVIALAVLAVVSFLLWTGIQLYRNPSRRREILLRAVLWGLAAVLTVMAAADWLWGVAYYADGLQEKSGMYAEDVSLEDLAAVTRYAAANLNEAAAEVPRDGDGDFAVSREEILAQADAAYETIAEEIPCLAYDDRPPKPVRFSKVMSHLRLTGVYFSYTGEANVNMDCPACLLPATVAHELAHQRGFASEKECNFAAVLAATTAEDAAYRYSGWLFAYIHLGNALYAADKAAWQEIRDSLAQEVKRDLAVNNAYWKPYRENGISEGYQNLYDGYLKNYGESDGVKSYGMVVDLLTVYYRDAARQSLS
ncbi:MAG: DUF3810 domain-containing protein [Oscillospiraceae bacterium]|nr:DUF3810 domain-containing protein [Oscillospiraceae bacterium]